jgi:hypothetical protein
MVSAVKTLKLTHVHLIGIYLGVYCLSISALLKNTNSTRLHRNFYIIFSTLSLLFNTIYFAQLPYTGQMMWIVTRNTYPGGPLTYYNVKSEGTPINVLGNIAQNLALALNDGLLVSLIFISEPVETPHLLSYKQTYRCYVIFGSRLYVVVFPVLCTLGTLGELYSQRQITVISPENVSAVLGMATVPFVLSPKWPEISVLLKEDDLNAAAITLDTVLNLMVTGMISFKILSVSRSLNKSVDSIASYTRTYTNVVTILVESAAPCAILGILTCIGWFLGTDTTSNFGFSSNTITLIWSMSLVSYLSCILKEEKVKDFGCVSRLCFHNSLFTGLQTEVLGRRKPQES